MRASNKSLKHGDRKQHFEIKQEVIRLISQLVDVSRQSWIQEDLKPLNYLKGEV